MKKKIVAIIISSIVAVGGIIATIVVIFKNKPEMVVVNSMVNFVEDLGKREELRGLIKTLNGGSVEFSTSSIKKDDIEIFDTDIKGKAYFSKDAVMLKDLKVDSNRGNFFANAYFSREFIYINESKLVDKSYGVTKGDMAWNFENSIFAFESGSDLAISNKKIYDAMSAFLSSIDGEENEKYQRDSKNLLTNYIKELYKITCKTLDFEVQTETVKFGSENKDVRVIYIEVEDEDVEKIVKELLKFIKGDNGLKKLIKKYSDEVYALLKSHFDLDNEDEEKKSFEDVYQSVIQLLELAIDKVDVKFSGEFDIKIITPKFSSKLLKLTVAYERFNLFTLDLNGKGIKDTNKITIYTIGRELVYEVKEKTSDTFKCEVLNNDKKILSFRYDKKDRNYQLELVKNKTENLTAKGKFIKEDGFLTITCDVIKLKNLDAYEENKITNITTDAKLIINQKEKIPITPQKAKTEFKYDKISNMTEEEVLKFINFIDNIVLK